MENNFKIETTPLGERVKKNDVIVNIKYDVNWKKVKKTTLRWVNDRKRKHQYILKEKERN